MVSYICKKRSENRRGIAWERIVAIVHDVQDLVTFGQDCFCLVFIEWIMDFLAHVSTNYSSRNKFSASLLIYVSFHACVDVHNNFDCWWEQNQTPIGTKLKYCDDYVMVDFVSLFTL